ncbi:MAG: Lrp/AsnC family transcriptional regulator [Bacteroidota bacterium]|nr:Lrp/AsnC family transcriptional regulator [Bacteroidota bacterium]
MPQLDKLDIEILNILQQDSTISVKDIAEKIGLTTTPTYERMKRMEQDGIITNYVALIDREKVGLSLLVYCNIVLKEQSKKALLNFEKSVMKMPEVIEVTSISGNYDYMLKIVAKDVATYNDFVVNVISNIPNIGQYHSSIVLKEVKKETAYKV